MLSSCSLVGSATTGTGTATGVAVMLLLLLVILAGSWGAGALFTRRPSFSIFRWSLGGGTGLVAELGRMEVAGEDAEPF